MMDPAETAREVARQYRGEAAIIPAINVEHTVKYEIAQAFDYFADLLEADS